MEPRGEEFMKIILFVLHDPEKLDELLTAWEEAGVSGATVLFSTGLGRIRQDQSLRDDIPLMPSLGDFFPRVERLSRTVFTIVEEDTIVDSVIAATERVVGDLTQPDRGLLAVLPVTQIRGLRRHTQKSKRSPA
jgi:nitrogen regulatory protein P-II 1